MLFRQPFLEGIRTGAVTLAFRRWRRPSVRSGGTLLTPVGQLHIKAIDPVALNQISAADVRRAGYGSRELLVDELQRRSEGEVYRIKLGPLRPDPRLALREREVATEANFNERSSRLTRWDGRSTEGAWTLRTLESLHAYPGVRAGDLCGLVGQEKDRFKLNMRKLNNLGLTVSLGTGYRLSPRGEALLHWLHSKTKDNAIGARCGRLRRCTARL